MNICPVLRPVERTRIGIVEGSGDRDVELVGLGRVGVVRKRLLLPRGSLMARRRAYGLRLRARPQLYTGMPEAFRGVARIPVEFHPGLHGFEEHPGLGISFKGVRRRLRRLTRSRLFKIAAIGTAAYFAGPLVAKGGLAAARRLKKLRARAPKIKLPPPGTIDLTKAGSVPSVFAPPTEAPTYPAAPAASAGGGGGAEVPEPEATTDQTAPAEAGAAAGMFSPRTLLIGGVVVGGFLLLSGRRKRPR